MDGRDFAEDIEVGTLWGSRELVRDVRPIGVLRFERGRLSPAHARRIPPDACIEVESDGCAYLVIGGDRLLFAGDLPSLLRTLDVSTDCLSLAEDGDEDAAAG